MASKPVEKQEEGKQKKQRKGTVVAVTICLSLLLAFGGLTVYVQGYEGVYPNVYVGELNLSGKTPEEAMNLLTDTYDAAQIQETTFSLNCQDSAQTLSTKDLEIAYHHRETLDQVLAIGKSRNPLVRTVAFVKQLMGSTHIDPVITYRKDLLEHTIHTVAHAYEVEPVGYTFEIEPDKVILHAPVAGVKVDREQVIGQVENAIYQGAFSDIQMQPVTTPAETLDFDEFYEWLTAPAEDAYYTKGEDGVIIVEREKLQCTVDKDVVKAAVSRIEQSGSRLEAFGVTTIEPKVLAIQLTENLYKDKLGSYTTYYSGTAARNNNVMLATKRIDGYELMPGEEFSYDKTILPRTGANGYMAAPVYVGNKVESGMGGGICQPSSTLYGAALYANLEILERHNHSMKVGYMPPGLDATISQGVLDLRLKNNTGYPVKISGHASGGVLTFSIWGYDPENISVEVLRSGSGYVYTATRVVKKDGVEISRENLGTSRYVEPAPSETPAPSESAAPEESAPPEGETPEGSESSNPTEGTTPPEVTPTPNPTVTPEATQPPMATATPVPTQSSGIIVEE